MRDLDTILKEEPYAFVDSLRPASAEAVRARGDQRRRRHAVGVIAIAAIVLAAGGAAYALNPTHQVPPSGQVTPSAGPYPPFLVNAVDGQAYVLHSATNRVVAEVRRPAGVSYFEGVAGVPGDHEFFLAGASYSYSSHRGAIRFFRITLSTSGQPSLPQLLPGQPYLTPIPTTDSGLVTIPMAVSPDGTTLAYPSVTGFNAAAGSTLPGRSDSLIVQEVATGARRAWTTWPSSYASISDVSVSANGRVGVVVTMTDATASSGKVVPKPGAALTGFLLLNTAAKGSSLTSASRLVIYSPASPQAVNPLDPTQSAQVRDGVVSADGRSVYALIDRGTNGNELVVVSVATGKVSRIMLGGAAVTQPPAAPGGQAAPTTVMLSLDGSSLLFPLSVKHLPHLALGHQYVIGHLAVVNVVTGRIIRLAYPLYYGAMWPVPPVQAAW